MNTNTYENWTKEQLIALVDELHLEGSRMNTELKTTKQTLESEIKKSNIRLEALDALQSLISKYGFGTANQPISKSEMENIKMEKRN